MAEDGLYLLGDGLAAHEVVATPRVLSEFRNRAICSSQPALLSSLSLPCSLSVESLSLQGQREV